MNATSFHYHAVAIPAFLLLLASVCAITWFFLRAHRYLLWQAISHATVTLAFTAEMLTGLDQGLLLNASVAILYLLAEIYAAYAITTRMGRSVQPATLWAIGLLVLAGIYWYTVQAPDVAARKALLALALAMVLSHVLLRLWRAPKRHMADRIAVSMFSMAALLMWLRSIGLLNAHAPPAGQLSDGPLLWANLMALLTVSAIYTSALIACAVADSTTQLRAERDHDGLTNLLNRRAFQEVSTCTPYTRGFNVLVLCDLDHFKCINDQYGHAVGDDVLRQFGQLLQTVVREADVTARLGGEEFVLEFKHTPIEHAKKLIARIQTQMSQTHWSAQVPQLQVTASFGMVLLQAQEHLEQSLARADALMYQAKKSGRNRLLVEGETSMHPGDGLATA